MKENDPGYQAPSTRQSQGGQRKDKQLAYSPHTSLPHSLSLSLSLCGALYLTLVPYCVPLLIPFSPCAQI